MKHSLEDVVKLLHERVGGQWEGSEIDGRDAIFDAMRQGFGYSNAEAREVFDALLASGELRYRRVGSGERAVGDDSDVTAEADGAVAPALVPGAVGGIGLNGPGTGGTGIFPAAVGAGLGGGFWQIGHAQDDELPPFAGRKGQVDPTV